MFPEQASLNLTLCLFVCLFVQVKSVTDNKRSEVLHRVSNCPYRLAIKATSVKGESPWSEYKYFGDVAISLLHHVYLIQIVLIVFCLYFFMLCRGRSSPLPLCCHFLPTAVCWPGSHASYLLQEVCGTFSSSPFAIVMTHVWTFFSAGRGTYYFQKYPNQGTSSAVFLTTTSR